MPRKRKGHAKHGLEQLAELGFGVVEELGRHAAGNKGSHSRVGHSHGLKLLGETLVKGAAWVAPSAVATASAASATVTAALTPVAVAAVAGYGAYKLFKWLST